MESDPDAMMCAANEISSKIQHFSTHIPQLRDSLVSTVRAPCEQAITTVIELGTAARELELIPASSPSSHRSAVLSARTRNVAARAHEQFVAVHQLAQSALQDANKTAVEVAYWSGRVDTCVHQVRDAMGLLQSEIQETKEQVKTSQQTIEAAQRDIQRANETIAHANGELIGARAVAIVRDVFTFGLGVIADLGNCYRNIGHWERVIADASRSCEDARNRIGIAEAQLANYHSSIERLSGRQDQLNNIVPQLDDARQSLNRHREHMLELVTTTFDVSVFLGGLAAQTAPWDAIQTASGHMEAITKLQSVVNANPRLIDICTMDAARLNDSLRSIASADLKALMKAYVCVDTFRVYEWLRGLSAALSHVGNGWSSLMRRCAEMIRGGSI
ncbi:hypothetical protein HETIRDRAFT_328259 [Heterobasidion irregulare TC 32-1]|uniref:Uncharacterized protein n=1 Tax=Heterobasidion irregulare (strain TC 32-1) TaxID=747525 RepID=W4JTY6_HETIT|nr:uncharacterized protein HETIRDRAFT_328259 [Heterobasidion irregulare TC 32-1]ETW76326.1 hypothetical protein HETIRDRAFT_328259 [Heterobasidion irregulare TC 32-1]